MLAVFLFFIFLLLLVIAAFALKIIFDSVNRKGELGVNLMPLICPRCGKKTELFRTSNLINKPSWGGGACSNCGCEMDKWGNEVPTVSETNTSPKSLEQSKTEPFIFYDSKGKTPVERIFDENNK